MDQLNQYLEQLASTSASELHLIPNGIPYLISAEGQTDLDIEPLQGSQISIMVFPLIPADVRQELPNRSSVQFTYPSNVGEFDFTVNKTPAGFSVTVRTVGPAADISVASPALAPAYDPEPVPELPSIDMSASSFPPIDLQPLDEPLERATWQSDSPAEDIGTGLPEFEGSNGISFDDFTTRSTIDDNSFTLSADQIEGAQEYTPPQDHVTTLPAEHVIRNPVVDRRASDRSGSNSEMRSRLEQIFRRAAEIGASDLHLSAGSRPMVRKHGRLQSLAPDAELLGEGLLKDLLHSIMPDRNKDEFAERRQTRFACEVPGLARFRANIFTDLKGMGAAFRLIPSVIPTPEQLGLPKPVIDLCGLSGGLVIVTGPASSGRSTTLAAMVHCINTTRECRVVTIEEPVEFVHGNLKCLVSQREVRSHSISFNEALLTAVREDHDVIMVGEMRDPETLSLALEAAETGRLVLATLHAATIVSTVDRIIDQFPAGRQRQIGARLSESLKAVVAQTLVPKGQGFGSAFEVLVVTPEVSDLIREGKTSQIASAMQTGKAHGMVMLNDALYELVHKGIVEPRDAYLKAVEKTEFEAMLTKGGYKI